MDDLANRVCTCTNTTSRYNLSTWFAKNCIVLRKNSDVFISCESENQLTARYTISQYLYHSLLSETNLSQHTFCIILFRDKVPKTELERKVLNEQFRHFMFMASN